MPSFTVAINAAALERLQEIAVQMRRAPRIQASVMLEDAIAQWTPSYGELEDAVLKFATGDDELAADRLTDIVARLVREETKEPKGRTQ